MRKEKERNRRAKENRKLHGELQSIKKESKRKERGETVKRENRKEQGRIIKKESKRKERGQIVKEEHKKEQGNTNTK